jgi:hypothetical protein
MRVEKAVDLAHFLLKENSVAIDTYNSMRIDTEKIIMNNETRQPGTINLKR